MKHIDTPKFLLPISLVCAGFWLAGCKTPPEVKQALVSLDKGYSDNAKLMQQYHALAESFKERHGEWNLYVKNRQKLDLALRWATTDPQSPGTPKADYAEESRNQLGDDVLKLVNEFRLGPLPAQTGTDTNHVVFQAGTNTIDALIQAIPALVQAVSKKAADEQAVLKQTSAGFDDYAARVAALRRINDAISRYLNIDVTIKPEDVRDIAGSARTLSGK